MKTRRLPPPGPGGYALVLVLCLTAVALLTLAAAMSWTSDTRRTTERNNEYQKSLAAAEAATEKAVGLMESDFRNSGAGTVWANLARYHAAVPLAAEEATWGRYAFSDGAGHANQLIVTNLGTTTYTNLGGAYQNLKGMAATFQVGAAARNTRGRESVIAGVRQQVQVATIPLFQFAIFYNILMEISCGQPFNIWGQVHANQQMYVLPDSALTFRGDVGAVGDITFSRAPGDSRGPPAGAVTYQAGHLSGVASLNLPIGTNNSPAAVQALLDPPPSGEDPNSAMGKQRFYNQADLIVTVSNATITATSGRSDGFGTDLSAAEVNQFVSTNATFHDAREGKTVEAITVDVGNFTAWNATNATLRVVEGHPVGTLYVQDKRTLGGTQLGAVRLQNGTVLPSRGLTVVTPQPLYVQGNYNGYNSGYLGTTNTSATYPAALMSDAITILSSNWKDANSSLGLSSRNAKPTTVNAAIVSGNVPTSVFNSYSGGVENFPRFLENWGGSNPFTYNGSIVCMFPSRYATNRWGMSGVYNPPARNWSFDQNFLDPSKLPPSTPSLSTMIRLHWNVVAAQ